MSDQNKCSHLKVEIDTTQPPMTLGELIDMQESLQTNVYHFDFEKLRTSNENLVPFIKTMNLAIMDEHHEQQEALVDIQRYAYHGKDTLEAITEFQFELIDELHFVMNKFLAFSLMLKPHHTVLSHFEDTTSMLALNSPDSLQTIINMQNTCHKIWMRQYDAFGGKYGNAIWKHWKYNYHKALSSGVSYLESKYTDRLYDLIMLEFTNLFDRCFMFGMTQHQIGAMYVAKNKENIDRQQRGY